MALNRFSALPEQRIFNTHVGQDLGLLNGVLANKQRAYDEASMFNDSQDAAFGKFAVRNVDIARRDELHNQYVNSARNLVDDKYQGDYGQALPELRKLANSTANNEFWNHATSALSRQKDMYDTEKTIQKKGGTSLAFNRDAATKAVYNEDGTYNDIDFDVQERSDWAKPKMDLMKDIAKDSRLAGISQSSIEGVLQHGSVKGVNAAKVFSVARQMLAPYLSTPEGSQEMRYMLAKGATPEQAQANMLRSLSGIGSKQIGSEVDQGFMTDPGYLYRLKKADKEAEANRDLMELPGGTTGATVNPLAPGKIQVDEKGRPYTETTTAQEGGMNLGVGGSGTSVTTSRNYEQASSQLKELRKNFVKLHPDQANISDKNLATLQNKAAENSGLVAYERTAMAPKRAAAVSSMVLGPNWKKGDISNLSGSQIEVISPNGGSKKVTMDELQKQIGENKSIKSAQVTGRLSRHATIPGAYRVTMTVAGKDGEGTRQIELAVSGPKQEQEFKSQFQPLVESAYNGKPSRVQIGDITFKSVVAPRTDGKGFATQVRGYETLPNGNVVPLRERTTDSKGREVIKKGKNNRPVYAPVQSLEEFTGSMDNLFQKVHPNLFNNVEYTNKDAEEEVDLD